MYGLKPINMIVRATDFMSLTIMSKYIKYFFIISTFFISFNSQAQITSFPYVENFESGYGGWSLFWSNTTTLALGSPNGGIINSAASGNNAWVTNLSGNYSDDEDGFLISPTFDLSSVSLPVVEFSLWWNCEVDYDGIVLQSSIDNQLSWQNIGTVGSGTNWFNNYAIASNPGGQSEGWSGRNATGNGSGDWVTVAQDIYHLIGETNVYFRLFFATDGSVTDEGIGFDLFKVFDNDGVTVSIPDQQFEQALIDLGVDSDGVVNGYALKSDVSTEVELDILSYNISNFEGLQHFTNLTHFSLINNQAPIISSINFGSNVLLHQIDIINVPNLPQINVNQNLSLENLTVVTNSTLFNSIDVTNNTNLKNLTLANNGLTDINIENNLLLTYLSIGANPITSIDVSHLDLLETFNAYQSQIEVLDLSQNYHLKYISCHTASFRVMNLQNNNNSNLQNVNLSGNTNLDCILVDNVSYSEGASGWQKDITATYVDTQLNIDNQAQDFFAQDDGLGNQTEVEAWFNSHGGATTADGCGNIIWSYDYNIREEPNQNGLDIFYETMFVATDEFGNSDGTSASFIIVGIKHFSDFSYGTGDTICDDTFDLNTVITDIEPDADITTPNISYSFSREPNFEFNEGPLGDSYNNSVVDFPETGAGSYSYLYKVEIEKSVPLYRPESGEFDSVYIEEEAFITINDKTVAFEVEELDDITICPGTFSSIQDLTDLLVISPDLEDLPPQNPIDLNQYWSTSEYTGSGTYTFNPTAAFPQCPSNSVSITITEEVELEAGSNVLDAVDDTPYICGDTVTFNLNDFLDSSADSGGTWYRSNGTLIIGSYVDFPETGAGQFTKSFKYRQENPDCGFFSEALYDITYDAAFLSEGSDSELIKCENEIITENDLLSSLGADSGGFWSPAINPSNVASGVYTYSHNACGFGGSSVIEVIEICDTLLNLKVFVEGAYDINSGLMRDDMRNSGILPTISPYVDVLSCDVSVFNTTGSDAIVDWVWLEIRDSTNQTTVIESRSALLQADGNVVDVDGVSLLGIDVPANNYYIMISHRNHLGVLTFDAFTFDGTTLNIDLTTSNLLVQGTNNAIANFGDGKFGLFAGDFNGDGQIQNTDRNVLIPLIGVSGYNNADLNLNGEVQNNDLNSILTPNIGKGVQFMNRNLFAQRRQN